MRNKQTDTYAYIINIVPLVFRENMFCRQIPRNKGNAQNKGESAKQKTHFQKYGRERNREAHLHETSRPRNHHRRGLGPPKNGPDEGGCEAGPPRCGRTPTASARPYSSVTDAWRHATVVPGGYQKYQCQTVIHSLYKKG
jgi:hypothetical protein